MNIAIFSDAFIPLTDGVVTSTINLAKGLADRGHNVYIVAPKQSGIQEFTHPNVVVKRVLSIPSFVYPGFKFTSPISNSLIKYLKSKNIDVVHFQTPFTLGVQAIVVAKMLKKPLVGTFHTFINDGQYLQHIGINTKFIQRISWVYTRNYYNKCDINTCPSDSGKEELMAHRFTKPIKVISNGISITSRDMSDKSKAIRKYGLNNKTLLFIGRVAHEKNLSYLLDCIKLVVEKEPDVKLLIVGDGPQFKRLNEYVKQLGIKRNVIFTGLIPHKKLLNSGIFEASNIFVTASTTENQPLTLLESQINGLPCIGLDVKGIKDLIKDEYNGYVVDQHDKEAFANRIVYLLNNETLRQKMGNNSLKMIKKHDLQHVITAWEKLYSKLVNSKKKS